MRLYYITKNKRLYRAAKPVVRVEASRPTVARVRVALLLGEAGSLGLTSASRRVTRYHLYLS